MQMTEEISLAIDRHQTAVGALSAAMGPYREGGASLVADSEPELRLDAARQEYELSSLGITGLLLEQLAVLPEGDGELDSDGERIIGLLDDDVTTRLTVLIEIDAKIAEQASVLTEVQTPEAATSVPETRPLTEPELADLGPAIADSCEPMFSELRRDEETDPPHQQPPAPDSPDVEEYFDAILNRAGGDITGTITSSLSWVNRITAVLANPSGSFAAWSKDALAQGIAALRRLLIGSWRQVLHKVSLLVGQHAVQAGQVGVAILKRFDVIRNVASRGTGHILGKVLRADEVIDQAQALVDVDPARAGAAIAGCQKVDKHHQKRRRAVPVLNKALPACRLIPAHGSALEAVAAATLLIYSIWLAHDHVDSPVMASLRLPKNPGLLAAVQAAVN